MTKVVLITDIIDATAPAELLAAMMRLAPRYLPFCVTRRDFLVDTFAHTPSDRESSQAVYTRAVALDLLSQREVAFANIEAKGSISK